jgi:hypothetical protein
VDRVDFTEAFHRIKGTVEENPQFRAWLPLTEEHESDVRAQMVWPGDDLRLITLHVSCFLTPRSLPSTAEPSAGAAQPAS